MLEPMIPGQGYQSLVEQDRLVHAMVLTLLAVTSMSLQTNTGTYTVPPFRPQTNGAIIRLLNSIMNKDEFTPPTIFCPSEELNVASSMLVRMDVVPLWCLGVWMECKSFRADIFLHLATTYLHHHGGESNVFETVLSCQGGGPYSRYQDDVMTVLVELLTRCNIALSADSPPSDSVPFVMDVLHETCLLVRQSVVAGRCGAHHSTGYCGALLVLALQLCRMEQSSVANDLIIQSLSLIDDCYVCQAWKLICSDSSIHFQTVIDEAVAAVGISLTQMPVGKDGLLQVQQLMQFLLIIISKGVDGLEDRSSVCVAESVGRYLYNTSTGENMLLHETFLVFATIIRQLYPSYNNSKSAQVLDVEIMKHLASETRNLVVASAISVYIMSAPLLDPPWYLGAWEYLSDTLLLIKTHYYQSEDELSALAVGPTICDALLFLVNHVDNYTGSYIRASPKTKVLCETLATFESGESLRHRMSQSVNSLLLFLSNTELQESRGPPVKSHLNLGYRAALCEYRGVMRLILVHKCASKVGEGGKA
ncbi:hypothetical protein EDC04DRAFT_2637924 [Pisolithus marmoratus]|nr:hypothetical protein EDC04DRAFT_2637924 [Pisolithus marmoratus]